MSDATLGMGNLHYSEARTHPKQPYIRAQTDDPSSLGLAQVSVFVMDLVL